jgi:hypothetical protein
MAMSSSPILRRGTSLLPPAPNDVSEGFIELVFFLLGIGILLPWNAYISAKQYFVSRMCEENPAVAKHIEMWFSILYNLASVVSLAMVILVQYHTDTDHPSAAFDGADVGKKKCLIKSTSNLSTPMMCSKTLHVDTTRASSRDDRYTWLMVMVPLGVYSAVFSMTTIFVFVTSIPSQLFLMLSLAGLFICGVCTAVASSGIVGTAGLFHSDIGVNPYFNGQAFGGLLVACANFVASVLDGSSNTWLEYCLNNKNDDESASTLPDDATTVCLPYSEISWATASYFGMSCIVLAACMFGYNYVDEYKRLVRTNSFRGDSLCSSMSECGYDPDVAAAEEVRGASDDDTNVASGLHIRYLSFEDISDPVKESGHEESTALSKWRRKAMVSFASYQNGAPEEPTLEYEELISLRQESDMSEDAYSENSRNVTLSIWHSVQGPAGSLFFTYVCTLTIFPVWTSNLLSSLGCRSSSRIRNDLFTPLSFVIFNAGDLIGRSMSSEVKFEKMYNLSRKLVSLSIFRMMFLVVFLFCNSGDNRFTNWVMQMDLYSWCTQFAFAVTNGVITNVCFCYAPTLVKNRTHHQQVVSAILNFALSFGLLVGSFVSGPYLQFATTSR